MSRTRMLVGIVLLLVGVAACRPMSILIRAEENDRTLFDCYRTFEGDLQGELHLSSAGSTLKATLVATWGALNDSAPKMRWEGTGHRTNDDRIELVLDQAAYDSDFPSQLKYNADIFSDRLSGFLFDPSLEQLSESLTMDGCYGADEVKIRGAG